MRSHKVLIITRLGGLHEISEGGNNYKISNEILRDGNYHKVSKFRCDSTSR